MGSNTVLEILGNGSPRIQGNAKLGLGAWGLGAGGPEFMVMQSGLRYFWT